jgi:D-3-phosphoglycerate dehydrogenase
MSEGILTVALIDSDFDDSDLERAVVEGFGLRFVDARFTSDRSTILNSAVGVIVQYESVDRTFLDAAPRLTAVGTYGVGTDHIDVSHAETRGVEVFCVQDYCTQEVADHTLALVLAALRGVVPLNEAVHAGHWPPTGEVGNLRVLADCTYAIVGFGNIGQAVAKRVSGFGGRVRAYDPFISHEKCAALGVTPVSLEEAFESDVVSLHLPLTAETRQVVGHSLLARLPEGALLVNVSRGDVVDQDALATSVASGRIAAALDVLQSEPPLAGQIEALGSTTIVTPHAAWFSLNAEQRVRESAASAVALHVRNHFKDGKGA